MKNFFYYRCLRRSIIEFLDIFNDIKVAKYNRDGEIVDKIEVPIKLAPKQKFYYGVHGHKHEKRLPMMSAEITSIDHASDRKSGSQEKIKISSDGDVREYFATPAPYNVGFQLNIGSEYMVEMDQIAEQILPFFNPYVQTVVYIPEVDESWNMEVNFQGLSLDQDSDIAPEEKRRIIWTMEFEAKTYLLTPVGDVKEIKKVINKYYTTQDTWDYMGTESESPSGGGHELIEYMTIGEKDNTGKIIYDFEVFE